MRISAVFLLYYVTFKELLHSRAKRMWWGFVNCIVKLRRLCVVFAAVIDSNKRLQSIISERKRYVL